MKELSQHSFTFRNTLREPIENTMFLSPTTVKEVELAIKELQDKNATVPNSILSRPLKVTKMFSLSHFVT